MDADLLLTIGKYIGSSVLGGGILALWRTYIKWGFDTKNQRQKELKCSEKFLKNLDAKTPDFLVEQWRLTISSTPLKRLNAREIRYFLLFPSPTEAFARYRTARRYLEVVCNRAEGGLKLAYKDKYKNVRRQNFERLFGSSLYFIFMFVAVLVFPLSSAAIPLMSRQGEPWWLMLIITPVLALSCGSLALGFLDMGVAQKSARGLLDIESEEKIEAKAAQLKLVAKAVADPKCDP